MLKKKSIVKTVQNVVCSLLFISFLQKPVKGFLFAKLYFEAKEYELAKR